MIRKCKVCGTRIIGREDKRFCTEQCRNTFNNKVRSQNELQMKVVNMILRRNRKILANLAAIDKQGVPLAVLEIEGFDFDYFTSLQKMDNGKYFRFCYEYGYNLLDEQMVELIVLRRKEKKT